MAKWMVLQLNEGVYEGKQLVSKENIQYMHSPKPYQMETTFMILLGLRQNMNPIL